MGPSRPRRALALVLAAAAVRAAAGPVEVVAPLPPIAAPLSAPPALAQLRADLAALSVPATLALPPSALSLSPQAWTNIRALAAPAPEAPAAVAGTPAESAPAAPAPLAGGDAPGAPGAPAGVEAARARLAVAGEVLGRFDPAAFAALPDARRAAALDALWDGWRRRGLVAEPAASGAADAGRRLDALILEGVDDRALTSANKSIFLGVGVLGYPLEDALWLARTRIRDAIDENSLHYPEGQRWKTDDGTPEFLGVSARAQGLVDDWGAAAALGAQIVRQVSAGSRELPKSAAATPEAAADFARVAADLVRAGDREALDYLSGRDPTFSAFLLDVRKPGYYLYNGDGGVVDRILATPSGARLGLRRVAHGDGGSVVASSYFYRPARVVERLREAAREVSDHSADARARLAAYAERAAPLAARSEPPREAAAPYSFVEPEFLPGSALESAANAMSPRYKSAERSDIPLPLSVIRARLASGEPHPLIKAARWHALELVLRASSALAAAPETQPIRFVASPWQTRGRLVAKASDGSVMLQVAALDDVARLEGDPPRLARELRFLSAALEAALR